MTLTTKQLKQSFSNKRILVTGGTGSIGENIVSTLLQYNPKQDDSKQYLMQQKFSQASSLSYYLGDIRDYQSVEYVTRGIDIVFHVAALKQVPVCEENPFEAVKTNIIGSENLIKACIANKVKKVVNVSTDKAVNPSNTMGATKLIAEKLFKNANTLINNENTRFSSVRFGNVVGSRGSVIPLFLEQAKSGGPLTVTEPNMTRFFMTIPEAVNLTLKAACYSIGGETFIFKMNAVKISDLAEAVKGYCQIKGIEIPVIRQIGIRPGEKLYEELMYQDEIAHVVEDEELYVILHSSQKRNFLHFSPSSIQAYRSDQIKTVNQTNLISLLHQMDKT
jgi:FlaA1/EpsC-like NDP-sugar epimerase